MKTFFQPGHEIDFVVGGSAVVSGQVIVQGSLVGVAAASYAPGTTGVMEITGVHILPKTPGQVITAGAPLYYAAGTVGTTNTGTFIGYAAYAEPVGASTTVKVLLARPGA